MPANLENSAVATGLEKVSFHSNPEERQCHRMLKLPHMEGSPPRAAPLPTHFLLGQAVGYLGSDSMPDVRRQQRGPVVLGLNTDRAHLLPPRGHCLGIPGLFDGHYRQMAEKDTLSLANFPF